MSFKRPVQLTAEQLIELHKEPGLGLLNPAFNLNESSSDPSPDDFLDDQQTGKDHQMMQTTKESAGGQEKEIPAPTATTSALTHSDLSSDQHPVASRAPLVSPVTPDSGGNLVSPGIQMRKTSPLRSPDLASPPVPRGTAQISPLAVHSISASSSFSAADHVRSSTTDSLAPTSAVTSAAAAAGGHGTDLQLLPAVEFGGLVQRRRLQLSDSPNASVRSAPRQLRVQLPQTEVHERPLRRSETVAALAAQHGVPATPPSAQRRPLRHSDNLYRAASQLQTRDKHHHLLRQFSETSINSTPELMSSAHSPRGPKSSDTAFSLHSLHGSTPGTPSLLRRQLAHSSPSTPASPNAARRPLRLSENLQNVSMYLGSSLPTSPNRHRHQSSSENLLAAASRSATAQRFRLVSASSLEDVQSQSATTLDSQADMVLTIDQLELDTLKEGELVTLPTSTPRATAVVVPNQATAPADTPQQPSGDTTASHKTSQQLLPPQQDADSIESQDSKSEGAPGADSPWGGAAESDASFSQLGPNFPPATNDKYKHTCFKNTLAVVGSAMYATFLVIIGFIVFVADIVNPSHDVAEIFTSILAVVGLCWLVWMHFQVQSYLNRLATVAQHSQEGPGVLERQLILEPTEVDGEYRVRMPFKQAPSEMIKCQYSFSVGRHSGSFYLKIGAAFFCFGHLVHLILLLIRHVDTTIQHGHECTDIPSIVMYSIQPVFSFFQLYVTFKYSNIVISHHQASARFGFMHCIASSLNLWIWSIVRETIDAVQDQAAEHGVTLASTSPNCTECTVLVALEETTLVYQKCVFDDSITEAVASLSGYLFPLTIEFNILIVGVWFVIWQNIGNTRLGQYLTGDMAHVEGVTNEAVLHIDCGRANRGLMAGLLVFVAVVVDIILFFSLADEEGTEETVAQYIAQGGEAGLTALMTVLSLLAYNQLTKLDINLHPVSFLDDLLLFICLPAFFAYGVIILIPALAITHDNSHNYILEIMVPFLLVAQVVVQTPLLMDGLRRCSNSEQLRASKPGREYVTVLLFSNVAMWLLQTLENQASQDQLGAHFYGSFVWTMLRHATTPLCLFYRFHSSVCLADIWKSAYEPGS